MNNKKLNDDYRSYVFDKRELEKHIGFKIDVLKSDVNEPYYLKPYKSRITLSIDDCAGILSDNDPNSRNSIEFNHYRESILNAVKNNILEIAHGEYDINGNPLEEYVNKNEIGKWAKDNDFNWPFPINDELEETNQNNSELLSRIKQLEQDLEEQKKINDEYVEVPFYESQEAFFEAYEQGKISSSSTDNEKLIAENNQLKNDNQKLVDQLDKAKKEIEKLNQFISSNGITESTEEYLKTRERNNHYSLIGGLLYLLLTNSRKNLNQTAIILSLLDKFKGEPFSKRHLEGIFPKAKIQLRSNHPEIEFD